MTVAEPDDRSGTPTRRSIAIAGAIVAAGVVAGLVVGGAFEAAAPSLPATPSPSPVALNRTAEPIRTPIVVNTATPRPSPTPTPTPTLSIATATPGPDGISPPLPPIELAGADEAVIAALDAAVAELAELNAYRFTTIVSGRNVMDLSSGGADLGLDGSLTTLPSAAFDVVLGFRLVEFDCSAATGSSQRIVVVDDDVWAAEDDVLVPMGNGGSALRLLNVLSPVGVASRVLIPFAAGFEHVGAEEHDGIAATRYRATRAGIDAYAAVTEIHGDWTADAWVADAGYLLGARIQGTGPGDCDSFYAEVTVRDVGDPGIVIARPS
jgi:hypothetical protein